MQFKDLFTYPDTDVETVYAIIADPSFREEALVKAGATEVVVTIESNGDGQIITNVRRQPAPVPDWVKRTIGDTVLVEQVESWSAPDEHGIRSADVTAKIIGQPASMRGTATLIDGDPAEFVVEGKTKVKIPILGKKLEAAFADAISETLRGEVELGMQRL